MSNVASLYQYQDVRADMRGVLLQWMKATGDDVPSELTKSAFDREEGMRLPGVENFNAIERGEMPGTRTNAVKIKNKGPL